jgi:glycosyltransferase involved in cell wall biosynthesis
MINNPIISICIPTYNRADFLKICINNIINQDAFSENKIEIVISDNNSPDNTYEVVKTFQKNYSNIKYFKNHENI